METVCRSDYCLQSMTRQHIRPRSIIVNDCSSECDRGWFRTRFVLVKPFCCFFDTFKLLCSLAIIALIYSIVALVLTCIYTPHFLDIICLSISIVSMTTILGAVFTKNRFIAQFSFCLTMVLLLLIGTMIVHTLFVMFTYFNVTNDWRWKFYLITKLIFEICSALYIAMILYMLLDVITFCKQAYEERQSTNNVPCENRF